MPEARRWCGHRTGLPTRCRRRSELLWAKCSFHDLSMSCLSCLHTPSTSPLASNSWADLRARFALSSSSCGVTTEAPLVRCFEEGGDCSTPLDAPIRVPRSAAAEYECRTPAIRRMPHRPAPVSARTEQWFTCLRRWVRQSLLPWVESGQQWDASGRLFQRKLHGVARLRGCVTPARSAASAAGEPRSRKALLLPTKTSASVFMPPIAPQTAISTMTNC